MLPTFSYFKFSAFVVCGRLFFNTQTAALHVRHYCDSTKDSKYAQFQITLK